jgi:hypothetical protein
MRTNLTRHLAAAQAALWFEHDTVRREYTRLLAQGNHKLARRLYQARHNDAHFTECIALERKLKKSDRRYAVSLNRYGLRVWEIIVVIDRLKRRTLRGK